MCFGVVFLYRNNERKKEPSGVPGWASSMCVTILLGGMNMVLIGLVGEYVGRIYIAQNNAPQFIIRETVNRSDG